MVLTIKDNNEAGTIYGGIFGKLANEKDPNSWMNQSKERIEQYNSFITSKNQSDAQKYLETLKNIDKETYDIISKYDGKKVPLEGADKEIQKVSAGFDAARLKAIAFNAAVNIGVALLSTLVMWGVQQIADSIETAEEKAESAAEALDKYSEAQDKLKSNRTEIDGFSDEYEKLAKGVNKLGENVSLSSDEFDRYHEITNKIAEMFPEMIQGWDDEGNAIIRYKGNIDKYLNFIKLYKKTVLNLYVYFVIFYNKNFILSINFNLSYYVLIICSIYNYWTVYKNPYVHMNIGIF